MYQAKTGQRPPQAMQAVIAAFETAQLEQMAREAVNRGAVPRNLTSQQRKAVIAMASTLKNRSI